MDEKEFRAKQIKWDEKSLDKRIERWKQIVPATYDGLLPKLVWDYLSIVDEMYIAGHFVGTIIVCAAIMELILVDLITNKSTMTPTKIEKLKLNELITTSRRLDLLNDSEQIRLDELRKLRNSLVHGKVGELNQMAKRRYTVSGSNDYFVDADFYISSGFEGGIDQDAFTNLSLIRELSVKFYGADS